MNKIFLVLLSIVVFNANVYEILANSKLSPYSQLWLDNNKAEKVAVTTSKSKSSVVKDNYLNSATSNISTDGVETIGAFISVESLDVVSQIKNLGAIVNFAKGDIVVASLPVDMIEAISELDGVKRIEIEKSVHLKNDAVRSKTNVDIVQSGGNALNNPYTGEGVLVGICDQGIDFNHLAFMDENGVSRVKRAYLPDNTSGTAPTLADGSVLVGSAYETPEAISTLTTDTYAIHGTHVTGIAAGSYMGNDYYGMAPGSDLILSGVYSLTDYNMICAVSYVMDRADELSMPISVNLSIGNNYGAHDGSSLICRTFEELVGAGKILSVCAGNEGADKLYITKEFTAEDNSAKTLLVDYYDGYSAYAGFYDAWSRDDSVVGARFFVYSFTEGETVYESPILKPEDGTKFSSLTISTDDYPELAKYYEGSVDIYSMISSDNNKYEIFCEFYMISDYFLSTNTPDYCLGIEFIGSDGDILDVWVDDYNTYFSNEGVDTFVDGTPDSSLNSLAYSENTICVGSYDSKVQFTGLDGKTYTNANGVIDDISFYSSYAPLVDGEFTKPDIVAPGALVVSSINSYDSSTISNDYNYMSDEVVSPYDGKTYYWMYNSGTSMATPVVTGIIALWLEADSTLTPERIKEIFAQTAIRDDYVTDGDARRWGYGKIDAYAGLIEILESASVEGVVDTDKRDKVLIYNQNGESFDLYVPSETETVRVNIYEISGSLLYSTVADGSNVINVDASGKLGSAGIKIVQVVGSQVNYSTKIIIK
ncbi:MAG: S8 family peptidase [Bacteroidales bacterium]